MKLFQVMAERDGNTIKSPGVSQTEVIRDTMFFAANTIDEVWERIAWIRNDPERDLISISEVAPQVTVIES